MFPWRGIWVVNVLEVEKLLFPGEYQGWRIWQNTAVGLHVLRAPLLQKNKYSAVIVEV